MRLVLDTAVMVAAIRSNTGASRHLLEGMLKRRREFSILISVPLLIEYEAVMTRPEHLRAAGIAAADVGILLDAIGALAEPVTLDFMWRPILSDADDDMVLETAANGRADAIVTFNRRDFAPAKPLFGIAILSPGETVEKLEARS